MVRSLKFKDGSPLSKVLVAAITIRTFLRLIVLASAKTGLLNLIGILSVTFEDKLQGLELCSFMRSVTEWLVLGFTACAIIVGLPLLKINFV